MQPILHLSIPVRDMDEASAFYVHTLGCQAARARDDFTDVWFFGMQLTLQDRPDEVSATAVPEAPRHFGVTLGRDDFDGRSPGCRGRRGMGGPGLDRHEGQATEQTKAKVADPSGNVIELKTYRDVDAALRSRPTPTPRPSRTATELPSWCASPKVGAGVNQRRQSQAGPRRAVLESPMTTLRIGSFVPSGASPTAWDLASTYRLRARPAGRHFLAFGYSRPDLEGKANDSEIITAFQASELFRDLPQKQLKKNLRCRKSDVVPGR